MVNDPQIDMISLSKESARNAARNAAIEFEKDYGQSQISNGGAFALYTWGALAFASVVFATTMGIFPEMMGAPNNSDSTEIVAQNDKSVETSPDIVAPRLALKPRNTLPQRDLASTSGNNIRIADPVATASLPPASSPSTFVQTHTIVPSLSLGVDIGHSSNVNELAVRYLALSKRAPDLFHGKIPLVQLNDEGNKLQAKLIAGPFSSKAQLASFCREIRLRMTIDCAQTTYQGEEIWDIVQN